MTVKVPITALNRCQPGLVVFNVCKFPVTSMNNPINRTPVIQRSQPNWITGRLAVSHLPRASVKAKKLAPPNIYAIPING